MGDGSWWLSKERGRRAREEGKARQEGVKREGRHGGSASLGGRCPWRIGERGRYGEWEGREGTGEREGVQG